MTIREAKKMKWGTVLRPSRTANRTLFEYRSAIFLGVSRDGNNIVVVVRGSRTVGYYAPVFWLSERATV